MSATPANKEPEAMHAEISANIKLIKNRMAFALSRADIVPDGERAILRVSEYDLGRLLSRNPNQLFQKFLQDLFTDFVYNCLTPPPENLYFEYPVEPEKAVWAIRVQDMDLAQEIKKAAEQRCLDLNIFFDAPATAFARAAARNVVEGRIAVLRHQLAEAEASAHHDALALAAEFRSFAVGAIARGHLESVSGVREAWIAIKTSDVREMPLELAHRPDFLVASFAAVAEQAGLDPKEMKLLSTETFRGTSMCLFLPDLTSAQRLQGFCRGQQP